MSESLIIFLVMALPIIVIGFIWAMVRIYSLRLSRIDEELRAITVMLSEMPKENSIKDYMYAQDQRLRDIGEKLATYAATDVLQQYIQDQANQIIAIISTQDESRKPGVTRADLEMSLQITNELLERVLWSLRFDEDKYVESTAANSSRPEEQGKKNINIDTKRAKDSKDENGNISMKSILNDGDDGYGAILKYMQQSGKSGTEALRALEAAKVMRNR